MALLTVGSKIARNHDRREMPICYQSDEAVLSLGRTQGGQMAKDGRSATQPYRVRVGGTWYWVDPTVPRSGIAPGDTLLIYPKAGEPALAVLQSPLNASEIVFASLEGDGFGLAAADIAALHLAAVDEVQ
jgi:hypothetical protein